jgi:hypothetical protein
MFRMKTICAFQLSYGQECWWGGRKYFRSYTDKVPINQGGTGTGAGVHLYPMDGRAVPPRCGWGEFVGWNAKVEVLDEDLL